MRAGACAPRRQASVRAMLSSASPPAPLSAPGERSVSICTLVLVSLALLVLKRTSGSQATLVYAALSYWCVRPSAAKVRGLELLVCEASSY